MPGINFLRNFCIFIIILGLFVSLAIICDDDSSPDISCSANYTAISYYRDLIENPLLSKSLSYSNEHPASSKQFVLYVARQEKSPPAAPASLA